MRFGEIVASVNRRDGSGVLVVRAGGVVVLFCGVEGDGLVYWV